MSLTLDKSERYTAYVIMLAEIEATGGCFSLCHLSGGIFGIYPHTKSPSDKYPESIHFANIYPELWNKKPNYNGVGYWWNSWEVDKRIKALKQCIEETADF